MSTTGFIAPGEWTGDFKRYPVVTGYFGPRIATFSTSLSLGNVCSLLGHDPRSRRWKFLDADTRALYERVQRKTSLPRIKSLKTFLLTRSQPNNIAGALPAMSIAFPHFLRFVEEPSLPGAGVLEIQVKSGNDPIMIDGLGRLSTMMDLYDEAMDDDRGNGKEGKKIIEAIENIRLPVTIFAPRSASDRLSQTDLQQIFSDFNFKSVKISPTHAMSLDSQDIYTALARQVAVKSSAIKRAGGMDTGAPNKKKKSDTKPFVKLTDLRLFVKAAIEGEQWAANRQGVPDAPNASRSQMETQSQSVAEFLDTFADAMGPRFLDSPSASLFPTAKGWYTLGAIYHDVHYVKQAAEPLKIARKAGTLDWTPANPLWTGGTLPLVVPPKAPGRAAYAWGSYTGFQAHAETADRTRQALGITRWLETDED